MMTKSRALARARVTIGKNAHVGYGWRQRRRPPPDETIENVRICQVGRLEGMADLKFFSVDGVGDTWEEAFENADRRHRAAPMSLLPEEWEAIVAVCNLEQLAEMNPKALEHLSRFMKYVRGEEAKRNWPR